MLVCGVSVAGLATRNPACAESREEVVALGQQVVQLLRAGSYAQALPPALRAVAIAEAHQVLDNAGIGTSLNNLAEVYLLQARYAEAEPLYKRALVIREKALPAGHPDIATSLNNLGYLFATLGRLKEAEASYTRALEMRENALPAGHRDIATSLNNLAGLYGEQGRLTEAETLCKRALTMRETALPAGHPDIAISLMTLGDLNRVQGRLAETESLYARALEMREKTLPVGHPDIATSLSNIAFLHYVQKRLTEAEPLYIRALAIYEKALPEDHPYIATNLTTVIAIYLDQGRYAATEPFYKRAMANYTSPAALENLAGFYYAHARYAEAVALFKRAVALAEEKLGPHHREVADYVTALGIAYLESGRQTESEPLFKRALEIRQKTLPPVHSVIAQSLNNLANLYVFQGQFAEAEPLAKQALEIWEKTMPAGHPDIGLGLNHLGHIYMTQGRFAEAEPLLIRALEIKEKALPAVHPDIARSLQNLASLYDKQGRYAESESLQKRALAIHEKALSADHPEVAKSLSNLAMHYQMQGRLADARPLHKRVLEMNEQSLPAGHPDIAASLVNLATVTGGKEGELLHKRALEIWEKALPAGHPKIANTLSNLAYIYQGQGRLAEAEPLIVRALEMREKALPAGHPDIALGLNNLAHLYLTQGRLVEAEPLYKRVLEMREKTLPAGHRKISGALGQVSALALARKDWSQALAYGQRATAISVAAGKTEYRWSANYFRFNVVAAHRVDRSDPKLRTATFEMAQWAHRSEAAAALGQMAVRRAKGEGELAGVVREAQDLERQGRTADQRLIGALGRGQAPLADVARQETAGIEARLKAIDQRLASEFKEYAALANPKPMSIAETQALLRPDEALLLFLDTPELKEADIPAESFAWGVTKTEARWVKLEQSPWMIKAHVQALRCGLDRGGEWQWSAAQRWMARGRACTTLRPDGLAANEMLPFDLVRAHVLYQGLLGPFQDLIKDKHLLVVPFSGLATLPFGVLLTEPPDRSLHGEAAFRKAAWLGARQAITVLPSVSSLKALRELAKPSQATRPLVGFGNPLLDGDPGDPEDARRAVEARARQTCLQMPTGIAARVAQTRLGWNADARTLFRDGKVDVATIRTASPLPETADELCAVGRALEASEGDIHLGAKATKAAVMRASKDGSLARYRIVHFATHGLLAGETEWFVTGRAEPALLLTPPSVNADPKGTEQDDGLLTASDVSQLHLDADWVVLSACNTAGADSSSGGEALSGLATAFFYAGARALLVSHWYVDSHATVKIITKAFTELKNDTAIGRSEALRRSIVALMTDVSGEANIHPATWAPFVVVGEGAR